MAVKPTSSSISPDKRTVDDNEQAGTEPYALRVPRKVKRDLGTLNQLIFKSRSNIKGKKVYYWVLTDAKGTGIARSYQSRTRKIEAVRDAINALGSELWQGHHYVPNDDDYDAVIDEGIRLRKIEEIA